MRVLVLGSNGQLGHLIVKQLREKKADVTAAYRKNDQVDQAINEGYDAKYIDIEKDDIDKLAEKFKGFDQVVFSVGSGGSTGDDKTLIVDLDGAVKAIEASKKAGVQHFLMVSGSDSRRFALYTSEKMKPYRIAKFYADAHLRSSGLHHTIVHPGLLLNGPGTGDVKIAKHIDGGGTIPREDVARVIVEVLEHRQFQGQEFSMISGNLPIKEALEDYFK